MQKLTLQKSRKYRKEIERSKGMRRHDGGKTTVRCKKKGKGKKRGGHRKRIQNPLNAENVNNQILKDATQSRNMNGRERKMKRSKKWSH